MANDYEEVLAQLKLINDRVGLVELRLEDVEEDQITIPGDCEVQPKGWGVAIENRLEQLEAPETVHTKLDQLPQMARA
jgi:hypothetical protein